LPLRRRLERSGPVDFDDGQAVVAQEAQQAGTEVAGAFHADLVDGPERLQPGGQSGIAAGGGREGLGG
jgi:hypothetical protein